MESFSPEYIDAVAASRWNLWLIPLFLLAPILFSFTIYKRTSMWQKTMVVCVCVIFTWLSLCFYADHIWNTMELNAQTDAEWQDVTADTGRLFGPILVGVPLAIIYTLIWLAGCSFTGWVIRAIHCRFTNPKQHSPHQTYTEYRESLVREYKQTDNAFPTKPENARK